MSVVTRSKVLEIIDELNDKLVNLRMVLSDQSHSMGGGQELWESRVELALYETSRALRRAKSQVG
jgi:hypothetical protein